MVGVFSASVLDGEVIDDEAEEDWSKSVAPQAWGMAHLVVAMLGRAFVKQAVGKDACLGQAVHSFFNANVDVVLVEEVEKVVFGNDFLGDEADWYAHEFWVVHGGVQVKILDIGAATFCVWCGKDTVHQTLEGGDVRCHQGSQ